MGGMGGTGGTGGTDVSSMLCNAGLRRREPLRTAYFPGVVSKCRAAGKKQEGLELHGWGGGVGG